jgi:serine protease AprX
MVAAAFSVYPGLLEEKQLGEAPIGSKIDPPLEEILSSGKIDIPFILLFKEADGLNCHEIKADGLVVMHRYHLINGAAGVGSAKAIRDLAEQTWVEGLYLDGTVRIGELEWTTTEGSEAKSPSKMVEAQEAWAQGFNGTGVTVAVIDSGIDKSHPDLIGKVVGEINFVEEEDTSNDLFGHGTMCAGIIAGSGLASGGKYMGIAPGACLLNVRVIDSEGEGKVSDIIAGIEWALDNNADVLSLSLGGMNLGEVNPPITMAADNAMDAGAVVCVAAGNDG